MLFEYCMCPHQAYTAAPTVSNQVIAPMPTFPEVISDSGLVSSAVRVPEVRNS